MATVSEIAPELFRLSIYVPELDLQFNHFLVRDEEPSDGEEGHVAADQLLAVDRDSLV